MRTWEIVLPLTKPLNLNHREHWAVKAKKVKQVREWTALLARHAKVPPLRKITVELHYCPRDKRRRDPLNLVALLKPIEDGLVDAKVIPDDNPLYLEPMMPKIDEPDVKCTKRIYFYIREIE